MKARYINPYTDFGFKKLFGEEGSKNLLIDFLNQLLPSQHKIVNLTFKDTEQLSAIPTHRKAIIDIHCENEKGEPFIVEMQKDKIKFFKDRSLFCASFPIKEQVEKGHWDFKLTPVYCVAILDFIYEKDGEQKDFVNNVLSKDRFCQIFYDKLTFIFIEMPRFDKEEHQLKIHLDKWLYFFKHLATFEKIPEILNEEIFLQGFKIAEIANLDKKQLAEYEENLRVYWELKAVVDTAFEEGKMAGMLERMLKGKAEGNIEAAREMKNAGEPIDKISKYTGLSAAEIEKL